MGPLGDALAVLIVRATWDRWDGSVIRVLIKHQDASVHVRVQDGAQCTGRVPEVSAAAIVLHS